MSLQLPIASPRQLQKTLRAATGINAKHATFQRAKISTWQNRLTQKLAAVSRQGALEVDARSGKHHVLEKNARNSPTQQ